LCVSYPTAIEYSAILFLLFAQSSSISPRSFQRFRRTLMPNFNLIRQQMKNFPIRYNVAESGQFLQWGSMGKFLTRSLISMKFGIRVRLKRWKDRGEFELDWVKSKNYIAENSIAVGFDTHNTACIVQNYRCTMPYDDK